jgi:hypothetical protein
MKDKRYNSDDCPSLNSEEERIRYYNPNGQAITLRYCTTEQFWGDEVFDMAAKISSDEAAQAIRDQIYKYNPNANEKRIRRFIWKGE